MVRKILLLITTLIFTFSAIVQHSLSAQSIAINEVMASNATTITDEDGDAEDWIELYNYGSTAIDMTGYGLSDNYGQPYKWTFPSVIINPGDYLLVWASGKNRKQSEQFLHTNFQISSSGEEILLSSLDGILVDAIPPTSIPTDYSYGRFPDGTGDWFYYTETTPNAPNSSNTTIHPPDPPLFSVASGFYTDDFVLTLSHPDPAATIIYTVDGSAPLHENLSGVSYEYKNQYPQDPGHNFGPFLTNTYTSNLYSEPLYIEDRSSEPNKLANISSTWHYEPDYLPAEPIKKATIVRAVAVVDGVSSEIKTHTYFVSETSVFESTLPIASINLSEDGLFNYHDGIYVAGKDFDNWRENNPQGITNGHSPANYRRSDDVTEQHASFQYFVDGQEVLNQNIGLRLHGAFSRHVQNKTFRLYARNLYDDQNTFDYPFFGPNNSGSFKRLILRNSGNDAGNYWIGGALQWTISPAVYFRDAFIQKMVAHLRFDTQDYQPIITYVNGEYWGLLNMRERYDKHYLLRNYGIEENDLELLTGNASAKEGVNSHYVLMHSFITNNNLARNENYEYVKTLMDTDNFMDYQIAQIYARNTDWPGNNIDYFRKRTDEFKPNAPYGQDGRWRWLMYDTDHGFGWSGGNSYTHNTLNGASNDNSWAKVILRKLLENPDFRNDFINRYSDLLNSAFLPERLVGLIDEMANRIADEIPFHQERWNTLHNWDEHVELMREFAEKRPMYARSHIQGRFNLSGNHAVSLDVSDNNHGYVQINSIEITEKTPGVDIDPYPWSGIYFRNIPITVKALPKSGFRFSHWSGASDSNESEISITLNSNISLKAHFLPIEEDDFDVIYFWLMDNQIENNTPLQYLNSTYSLSGNSANITFSSSLGHEYPFEPIHPNWRKGSMERRNLPTPFNYLPSANNFLSYGSFDMRGIQIKQPFIRSGFENTLFVNFSTTNYHNIFVSLAAKDEGAANQLLFDYFDTDRNEWTTTGMVVSDTGLDTEYKQYKLNLSHVSLANDNSNFSLRIRFAGTEMTKDDGNRVTFNNIAIEGTELIPSAISEKVNDLSYMVSAHPNPFARQIKVHIDPSLIGSLFNLYNMSGHLIKSGSLNEQVTELDLTHLIPGVYVVKISGNYPKILKVIKK